MSVTWGSAPSSKQIRTATERLIRRRPLENERLLCARNLLLRGGWRNDAGVIHFTDGAIVSSYCSCPEGKFIICLHALAAGILDVCMPQRRSPRSGGRRAPRRALVQRELVA